MTGVEKLDRIAELMNKGDLFRTWRDNDEIVELRQTIKVSDFFVWLMARESREYCSETTFNKYMGTDAGNCTAAWNTKLNAAIDAGFVKRQTTRNHGHYITWVMLTTKGKKALNI